MHRQLSVPKKNFSKYIFNKTSRLTNSINSLAYKTFNNLGGLTYTDILSNYPKASKLFQKIIILNHIINIIFQLVLRKKMKFLK